MLSLSAAQTLPTGTWCTCEHLANSVEGTESLDGKSQRTPGLSQYWLLLYPLNQNKELRQLLYTLLMIRIFHFKLQFASFISIHHLPVENPSFRAVCARHVKIPKGKVNK